MKIDFTDIMLFFQWGCMLASAIFSIRLIGNNRIPAYMKNFYWYSLTAGVSDTYGLLQEYFDLVSRHTAIVIYSFFLAFHFIFLSMFIYRVLPKKHISKYIKIAILSFSINDIILSDYKRSIFCAICSSYYYKFRVGSVLLHLLLLAL